MMAEQTLQNLRDEIDAVLIASAEPEHRTPMLSRAVSLATRCELIGGEYDLRRLSGILTLATQDAVNKGEPSRRDAYAADLIAVLSEIADLGDEDAARGITVFIPKLSPELVEAGKAAALMRRKARDGE